MPTPTPLPPAQPGPLFAADPELSVVVVTYNSAPDLPRCFEALAREAQSVPLELICVDNGSDDDSIALAHQRGAAVLPLGANEGFPVAVNAGLAACRGRWVLLLNPDVAVGDGCLATAVAALEEDATIGLVGCDLRLPDGSPDLPAARRFRSLGAVAAETFGLTRLSPRLNRQYFPGWDRHDSRDVPCINGAFVLAPATLLRELGGLDTSAFMYLEDQELCRRVWDLGRRVRFVSGARAVHQAASSTRRSPWEHQVLVYLHRVDADITFIGRRGGEVQRRAAVLLFLLRAALGIAVGAATGNRSRMLKYRAALRWLVGQLRHRRPPPRP